MADRIPIDAQDPKNPSGLNLGGRNLSCEECEALLADALDGTLVPADSTALEAHASGCPGCTELLSRAKQGQEWLQFLAQPPVPADLVSKILAKTSGAIAVAYPAAAVAQPAGSSRWKWVPSQASIKRIAEPRLMMTAAMAFFSVALTLNLAGVRLTAVHLADLRPDQLRNNLARQFINSKVGVENYCYNLRIVYEMEARVRELKRNTDSEETQPVQPPPSKPNGSAHKGGGESEYRHQDPNYQESRGKLWGQSVVASLHLESPASGAVFAPAPAPNPIAIAPQSAEIAGAFPKSCVRPETDRAEGSLV
jgi:hypothetical protein